MMRLLCLFFALLLSTAAQAGPVRRVLVYGDSNSWGWRPVAEAYPTTRYPAEQRWTSVMAQALGDGVQVEVDALSGRTTDVDLPKGFGILPGTDFNGATGLLPAIARHMPLDLVVIMLGTNDLRLDVKRDGLQAAGGAMHLASIVKGAAGVVGTVYPAPQVLVVCPPEVGPVDATPFGQLMAGAPQRSHGWCAHYQAAGRAAGVPVFDGSATTATHGIDGIHFTVEDHARLGEAAAQAVRELLGLPPQH